MNTRNQKCNALQTVVGIFAHSSNAPQKLIETLNHQSMSISPKSIHNMIGSMSSESVKRIKKIMVDLRAAAALDNLDIYFKTDQPTLTHESKLVHMTTATFLPLYHGVEKADLKCTKELWEKSEYNRHRTEPPTVPTYRILAEMAQTSASSPKEAPESYQNLMAWHVRDILVKNAKGMKEHFGNMNAKPYVREQVPVIRTEQVPARAMNINVGTTSGNAEAIENLMRQGSVSEEAREEYVILTHGDLGTGEKINTLQKSRRIEETAATRFSYVIFIPGMFHIKMACVAALWKMYIETSKPRPGHLPQADSVFAFCSILRPKETVKIGSNPGFRLLHTLVNHILIASILHAWTTEVREAYGFGTIADWLKSKPSWEQVVALSHSIVEKYVAALNHKPGGTRRAPMTDNVLDGMKLWNRDSLLYVMTSYAANTGDVGSVQVLLLHWVQIWKAVGKHKYARHISKFLVQLDRGWNPRLSRAVRMNWFVNPTGKPDGFRGADWVVERNNLRHKRTYSGLGPNRTVAFIIKQSPLIDFYQNCHAVAERSFYLTNTTLKHPPPKMQRTLAKLQEHMAQQDVYAYKPDRTLPNPPKNYIAAGLGVALSELSDDLWSSGDGSNGEDEVEPGPVDGDIGVDES